MINRKKTIGIIMAVGPNGELGLNNKLPWPKSKKDMDHFQRVTKGGSVIMGRKTYESLPVTKLPKRENIVLTTRDDYPAPEGVIIQNDLHTAIHEARGPVWIIGGKDVFLEGKQYANELWLTEFFDIDLEADVYLDTHQFLKGFTPSNKQSQLNLKEHPNFIITHHIK